MNQSEETVKMKHIHIYTIIDCVVAAVLFSGCSFLRPSVGQAGYYIDNRPESKATVVIGSNGTQANAIHGSLKGQPTQGGDKTASAETSGAGQFTNWNSGDRSADIDLSAAIEQLNKVNGSSAGQNASRDSSPNTQTQTTSPTETHANSTTVPVAVSQGAASATAKPDEAKVEGAKE